MDAEQSAWRERELQYEVKTRPGKRGLRTRLSHAPIRAVRTPCGALVLFSSSAPVVVRVRVRRRVLFEPRTPELLPRLADKRKRRRERLRHGRHGPSRELVPHRCSVLAVGVGVLAVYALPDSYAPGGARPRCRLAVSCRCPDPSYNVRHHQVSVGACERSFRSCSLRSPHSRSEHWLDGLSNALT